MRQTVGMPSLDASTLLVGGDIYNTVDPFATAVLLEGGTVAWLGSDEAADGMGVTPGRGEVNRVDLAGDLIAPAFVNARADLAAPSDEPSLVEAALSAGVLAVHVVVDGLGVVPGDPRVEVVRDVRATGDFAALLKAVAASAEHRGIAVDLADLDDVDATLRGAAERKVALRLGLATPTDAERLLDAAGPALGAHGHRIDLGPGIGESSLVERLAALGVPVTVTPGDSGAPIAALLSAGAPVSLGFGDRAGAPWDVLRDAVFTRGSGAISARAAFTAATRGGWRAVGQPEEGVIRMGARARLARWKVSGLVVQAADDRVAAWSTDPRSGTPGLPDLHEEAPTLVEVLT